MATEIHSPFPDHRRQDPSAAPRRGSTTHWSPASGATATPSTSSATATSASRLTMPSGSTASGASPSRSRAATTRCRPPASGTSSSRAGAGWRSRRPLDEAADGAMEMRNAIIEVTTFKNFIAPVLLFPDMERDTRMEQAARNSASVYVVWGLDNLEEDLERIAVLAKFRRPPRSRDLGKRVPEAARAAVLGIPGPGRPAPGCCAPRFILIPSKDWTVVRWSSSTWSTCTSTRPQWTRRKWRFRPFSGLGARFFFPTRSRLTPVWAIQRSEGASPAQARPLEITKPRSSGRDAGRRFGGGATRRRGPVERAVCPLARGHRTALRRGPRGGGLGWCHLSGRRRAVPGSEPCPQPGPG